MRSFKSPPQKSQQPKQALVLPKNEEHKKKIDQEQQICSNTPSFEFSKIALLPPTPPINNILQPKLKINAPNDKYEQEADRIAEQIVRIDALKSTSKCSSCGNGLAATPKQSFSNSFSPIHHITAYAGIQRKCAKCEEEEQHIQTKRRHSVPPIASPDLNFQIRNTKGKGQVLPPPARQIMERGFGVDFGKVNIHTDQAAARMNQSIQARAFTVGQDVYFNKGEFQPTASEGKRLLAHELVHTLQQGGANTIRRQSEMSSSTSSPITTLIVEDNASATAAQMTKSDFLRLVKEQICATVNQALQDTAFSSDNCPYIQAIFAQQGDVSAVQIEALIRRHQSAASTAQSATEFIQLITARVRVAVNHWKKRQNLADIPEDLSALARDFMALNAETSSSTDASIQFKANLGGASTPDSPTSVLQQLGSGRPLDGRSRSNMERAFGTSFSDVEIHSDSRAASLSSRMNARAFTVGNHIAFNSGTHQPGTLVGDALMAHELAHVVQQRGSKSLGTANTSALEWDADQAAVGAMSSIWDKAGKWASTVGGRLKTGLRIQRCSKEDGPLEWIHNGLDVAGLIPGLGVIPDAINTGIYLIEGDWTNAGLSATAMIPVFGQGATATKFGLKVTKESAERVGKEGIEKGFKELVEKETKEKIVKETTQEAAEKAAKETVQEGAEKVAKETTQEGVEKTGKKKKKKKEGKKGKWGCIDVRCNVYPTKPGNDCPPRVIGETPFIHPSHDHACKAAQRVANLKVPRGCVKRHCNCKTKCTKK